MKCLNDDFIEQILINSNSEFLTILKEVNYYLVINL